MVEKDQLIKEKVETTGLFDFSGFYGYIYGWLREEGYGVTEEKYAEKVSGTNKDIDIEWKAGKGLSDYFRIELALKYEIKGMSDVEVEIDGKKKKMNKGNVSLEIKGSLITDPGSKWEVTPFYKFLRDAYNKYIIPARLDSLQMKVRLDTVALKEKAKEFLALSARR